MICMFFLDALLNLTLSAVFPMVSTQRIAIEIDPPKNQLKKIG